METGQETECRQSEVSSVLGGLQNSKESLREKLGLLMERISPVVRKEPPPEKVIAAPKQAFSAPLAIELDAVNDSLKGSISIIEEALEKLET